MLNNWEEIICNTSPIPQFGAHKHPLHYPAGDSFLDNQELAIHPHRQESQLPNPSSQSNAIYVSEWASQDDLAVGRIWDTGCKHKASHHCVPTCAS